MALYWITIELANGKKLSGAKEIGSEDVDFVHQHFYHLSILRLGIDQIRAYECMRVSIHSKIYSEWQNKNGAGLGRKGPGKYRSSKNQGTELGKKHVI